MNASDGSGERPKVPRILAVDDRFANLLCLQVVLEPQGYEILIESSGRMALALCANIKFDLFLLDVMMPDVDGIEIATRLRANPETADVPIVFLTAAPDKVIDLAFRGGPVAVIGKPFDLEVLRATVAHLLGMPTAAPKASWG
jgi:two-component system sensor histidine kinase/response regulator